MADIVKNKTESFPRCRQCQKGKLERLPFLCVIATACEQRQSEEPARIEFRSIVTVLLFFTYHYVESIIHYLPPWEPLQRPTQMSSNTE